MAGAPITPYDLTTVTTYAETDHLMIFRDGVEEDISALNFMIRAGAMADANLTTIKLATLDAGQKIKVAQLPAGYNDSAPIGDWLIANTAPVLTDGTGTLGDTYDVVQTGTIAEGAGTLAIDGESVSSGSQIRYDGTNWYIIPSAANQFDGTVDEDTAATSGDYYRTADVNDRQLSKSLSNALIFDGTSSVLDCGNNNLFHFNDGTNDTPFSLVVVANAVDHSLGGSLCGVMGASNGNKEYMFDIDSATSKLRCYVQQDVNFAIRTTDVALTAHDGKTTAYGVSFTADSAPASAMDDVSLYVNGVVQASTAANNASYLGMVNGAEGFTVGNAAGGGAFTGNIYRVYVFNRALSAAEHLWISKNPTKLADRWAGANLTSGTLEVGQRYRLTDWITADDFTNVGASSNADGVEFVATGTTPTTWSNSSVVTPIGAVIALLPENIQSDGDWIDASSNDLNGTNTGSTPLMVKPQTSGTFTPTITLGGAAVGLTYDANGQQGNWRKIADKLYHVEVNVTLTALGSSTGNLLLSGMPFASANRAAKGTAFAVRMTGAGALTSAVVGDMDANSTQVKLYDYSATTTTRIDDTNLTNTSSIQFQFVYQTV